MKISRDTPCLFITTVTKNRLPVFRTAGIAGVACAALNEARVSGGFSIFAYAVMPDHFHLLTDSRRKPSDTLRFIKGIVSRRVLQYLKENGFQTSLEKLRVQQRSGRGEYSLWQHHSNILLVTSESVAMQKVNYIHKNPVSDGLAETPEAFRWSSARCWRSLPAEDEPLWVEIGELEWRRS